MDLEELWNSNLQDCTPKSITMVQYNTKFNTVNYRTLVSMQGTSILMFSGGIWVQHQRINGPLFEAYYACCNNIISLFSLFGV